MEPEASVVLGPFELHEVMARGGMGLVFRATHRAQGIPAAIKVIKRSGATHEQFYEDFRREVHATAQLTHPGIVTLFDYGVISEEAAAQSDGQLVAGSPFLAMQLLEGGTLAKRAPGDFATLKRLLLSLLDALAHAHAHGLVHRDLKPPNVLFGGTGGGLKLVDFGIAHASDRRTGREAELDEIAGTHGYMAPEQVECRWREYGPWTDLYSLGIVAWELASGRRPFQNDSPIALMMMHLDKPLPPLAPRFEVPNGFAEWIERLGKKQPAERYQCAADAAAALAELEADEESEATFASLSDEAEPTLVSAQQPVFETSSTPAVPETIDPPIVFAHVPADWRGASAEPSTALRGAGQGLYFLRTVPLVGREEERDALWSALRRCASERSPRVVVLRGPSGTGKSRLADWLSVRAHETGAARILKATHDPSPGPAHGLARMLSLHYRCLGLRDAALHEHLALAISKEGCSDPLEHRAAASLIDNVERSGLHGMRFGSTAERYLAMEAILGRAASQRPVLVWIDDAQWAADALGLIEHALEAVRAPILFVLTVRDEALAERPLEERQISRIEKHTEAEVISVGPLSEPETGQLVASLLGLSGPLASSLRSRVGGNPLFAVQLIGDWIQRGVLSPTPEGFALAPGEHGEIPSDLHSVWIERVERVLRQRPPLDRVVLELAATLGSSVDEGELDEACALLGHAMPADLLEALTRASLCTHTEAGFAVVHGMLRESLLASAKAAGRSAMLHGICARMLEGKRGRGVRGRLAHHLAEAGELERALQPLFDAAVELQGESDFALARATLERREEILAELALPDDDPRWGLGWVLRAEVHRLEWDFAAARTWAENAISRADPHGWRLVRARALTVLAHCARQAGDLSLAEEQNRRALSIFVELGDDEGRVRTLLAMAVAARQRGEFARADEMYARAYAYFEMLGDERGAANALLGMAHLARHHRAFDDAEDKYARARFRFEQAGYRNGVADCLAGIGDLLRFRGDFEGAEAAYREVSRLELAFGSKKTVLTRLNLALVLVGQERFGEARRAFEVEIPALEREGKRAYLGVVHTVLLACVAAEGDLAAFDAHLARAIELGATRALVDEDMAASAERAGRTLLARGDRARAEAALSLAASQWEALGDLERANAVRALLA